ncbi:MAG: hypothetical protein ACE5EE_02965 [Fidelibacterota bacterium]
MSKDNQIVAIVGGAVAGSEAVYQLTTRGIHCVVIEQNDLPYGKIEDGLPKWHEKQRKKEMELINSRMDQDLVDFVPNIKIGRDLSMDELVNLGCSAVLMANGAWKDRGFPVKEIEKFEGKGFYYQNPFVYWYNHHEQPSYKGEQIDVKDNSVVVGGGLASIDVVKILQVELVSQALKDKGFDISTIELEHKGIPKVLSELDLTWDELGLQGAYLLYRRNVRNMPLASIPEDATPEKEEKVRQTRAKILQNAQDKFLFRFKDQTQPIDILEEDGKLVGLRMIKNDVVNNRAVPREGTEYDVRCSLVISSIGSIPEPIDGMPMEWSTYDIKDEETGEINGLNNVFGVGNAITGKGNIRVSRAHAREVATYVAENRLPENGVDVEAVRDKIKELQRKAGYDGNYSAWVVRNARE